VRESSGNAGGAAIGIGNRHAYKSPRAGLNHRAEDSTGLYRRIRQQQKKHDVKDSAEEVSRTHKRCRGKEGLCTRGGCSRRAKECHPSSGNTTWREGLAAKEFDLREQTFSKTVKKNKAAAAAGSSTVRLPPWTGCSLRRKTL